MSSSSWGKFNTFTGYLAATSSTTICIYCYCNCIYATRLVVPLFIGRVPRPFSPKLIWQMLMMRIIIISEAKVAMSLRTRKGEWKEKDEGAKKQWEL